jgi:hypothetical protein
MGGMEFQVTLLLIALYFVFVGNNVPETGAPTPQHRASSEQYQAVHG